MLPTHSKNKHSGSIMIMVVIMLPIILGIVSLAVDLGNVFLVRNQMQNAADAASLAAAGRLRLGTTAQQIAIATTAAVNIANLNGFPVDATTTITVLIPPGGTASYAADPQYARVTITKTMHSFFAGMVGLFNILQTKQAVAGSSSSPPCLISKSLILLDNGSQLNAPNCSIESNGSIQAKGGSKITAGAIHLTSGSPTLGGSITPSTATITGIIYTDPFTTAVPSGLITASNPVVKNGITTYSPGIYSGGINVSGNANFSPGVYWITGGNMFISGGTVTGSGVLFYNSSGSGLFNFSKSASITLSAPTSGTYTGLLLKQTSSTDSILAGQLNGNLDFPNALLHLDNATGVTMNTGTIFTNKITLDNGTKVTMTNYSSGSSTSTNVIALYE